MKQVVTYQYAAYASMEVSEAPGAGGALPSGGGGGCSPGGGGGGALSGGGGAEPYAPCV